MGRLEEEVAPAAPPSTGSPGGAPEAPVLARVERAGVEEDLEAGRDSGDDVSGERLRRVMRARKTIY